MIHLFELFQYLTFLWKSLHIDIQCLRLYCCGFKDLNMLIYEYASRTIWHLEQNAIFFYKYFKLLAVTIGIIYTPNEKMMFIVESASWLWECHRDGICVNQPQLSYWVTISLVRWSLSNASGLAHAHAKMYFCRCVLNTDEVELFLW